MPLPSQPANVAPAPVASYFANIDTTAADHEARIDTLEGTGTAVNSVNGETGTVILDAADVGALPASALVDDDTFASATASNVPSAESVKEYVNTEIAGAGGSGSAAVYFHDGSSYQLTGGRIFIGDEDPADDGFTPADGDLWEDTSA
jgi:hypothetical protein